MAPLKKTDFHIINFLFSSDISFWTNIIFFTILGFFGGYHTAKRLGLINTAQPPQACAIIDRPAPKKILWAAINGGPGSDQQSAGGASSKAEAHTARSARKSASIASSVSATQQKVKRRSLDAGSAVDRGAKMYLSSDDESSISAAALEALKAPPRAQDTGYSTEIPEDPIFEYEPTEGSDVERIPSQKKAAESFRKSKTKQAKTGESFRDLADVPHSELHGFDPRAESQGESGSGSGGGSTDSNASTSPALNYGDLPNASSEAETG